MTKIKIALIQNPNGTWNFAGGKIPASLAFVCKDGSAPDEKKLSDAKIAGPAFVGLKTRVWDTSDAAIADASEFFNADEIQVCAR